MASQAATSRQTGRVKFFNSTKGYGFIIPDDQAGQPNIEEVFVHHTAIYNSGGFKSLSEGEEVEYDLVQGPKGMQAANVSGPGGVPVRGDPYATYMRNTHNGYDGRSRYGDAASGGVGSGAMSGGGYGYNATSGGAPFGFPMPVPYGNVPQGYAQFGFYSPYAPSSPSQQPIMMVPPGYPSSPMYPPPHVQQHPQAHHPQQQQQQQQQPHTQQQQQPMMPLSEGQLLHEGNIGHGGPGHSSGDADGGKPPM